MKSVFLKNPHYIAIRQEDTISYGGSQQCFSSAKRLGTDTRLARFGCGNTAVSDACLYLAQSRRLSSPETDLAGSFSPLKNTYQAYARLMNRRYTFTLPLCGCTGPSLSLSLNHFFLRRKFPFYSRYMWINTPQRMLYAILTSLSLDIPVILAIGPNFPNFRGSQGVPFYLPPAQVPKAAAGSPSVSKSVSPQTLDLQHDFNEHAHLTASCHRQVHAHFVTITGIFYSIPLATPMLVISSWGQKYLLSYADLRQYIRRHGLLFTSSLVLIHPRRCLQMPHKDTQL